MALAAGTQVTDKVRLVRELGHGAMGEVWVGEHATLQTEVAVKFVSDEMLEQHPDAFRRFSIEAAAAARIKSPHVVRTFDHGEMKDGSPYIVMELLEGQSLQDQLDDSGPLSIAETYQVIRQVGKALDAAHEAGIIHRDVKPHNIFLSDDKGDLFIKLLDFGSAKLTDEGSSTRLTTPGTLVGTPAYICRDMLLDTEATKISHRTDLWSLGVVAYKCLIGEVPFQGESISDVCRAILDGELIKPSRLRKELSRKYDRWFAQVFHHEPEQRPQSGAEMSAAFKAVARAALQSTLPPALRQDGQDEQDDQGEQKDKPRSRRTLVAVGALSLSAAALFAISRLGGDESKAAPAAPASAVSTTSAAALAAIPSVQTSAEPTSAPSAEAPVEPSEPMRYLDLGDGGGDAVGDERRAPEALIKALAKSRVTVPAGQFWMGCAEREDSDCLDNEKPGKMVKLDRYAIDRVEVSVALYFRCVGAGGCSDEKLIGYQQAGGRFVPSSKCNWSHHKRRNHPMNCVDHTQAERFCSWVGARLPSEAEWEKAARGPDRRVFPWRGDDVNCGLAVMSDGPEGCRANGTWPTASKRAGASPYGLLNMAGNVREWVADWYDEQYYTNQSADNPRGPQTGSLRVGRGGSWGNAVGKFMRASVREGVAPTSRSIHLGFRCATSR